MKILYLITRAERGGAQVHVLDLVRGFSPHLEVEVAAGEDGFLLEESRKLGALCHIVPGLLQPIQPLADSQALWRIVKLLRRREPDLLHVHTSKAGVLGRIAGFLCGVPVLFTAHTWCFAEGTSRSWRFFGTPIERFFAGASERIITVSEANRQLALGCRVASAERLITIHNGVSAELMPSVRRNASEPPILVMVARFSTQKDHASLLEALSGLRQPFRLQLVGDGPTRRAIEEMVRTRDLSQRVEFLGDRSDVSDLLARASIFVLASHWEGFPLSILEAMRASLPVVASAVGGVPEAVVEGKTGFLVPRGSVTALKQRLGELIGAESLRERMGAAGRRLFEERFTADQMFAKTLALYRQVALPSTAIPQVVFGCPPEREIL